MAACPFCKTGERVYVDRSWSNGVRVLANVVLGLPLFLIILFAIGPVFRGFRLSRTCRACGLTFRGDDFWRRYGTCVQCGYDLQGNKSGVCPECGWPLPRAFVAQAKRRRPQTGAEGSRRRRE